MSALEVFRADALVVGTGVAGLAAALGLAPRRVHLLTKATVGAGSASDWAQGGVAVALGGRDTPARHAADTVAAGAGLVDAELAELLARDGVAAIRRLIAAGADFDRDAAGELALGREAAHSRDRILHAHGDRTGAELVRALATQVARHPSIARFKRRFAARLLVGERGVYGVEAIRPGGGRELHLAPRVVLATGGCGQIWTATTNPREATGDGLALAAAAGARLVDLEFVQFHPTALAAERFDPRPLLTEALRGEGAWLVDDRGERFMPGEHEGAELAPRDVVARAIWRRLVAGRRVFLDARRAVGERFPERFPAVFEICRAAGLDPRVEPIPVAPAAHYHMGGVEADRWGRTSVAGLWACGEVASTGVHGANRLASNSLLEALVFGARVAQDAGASSPERPVRLVAARPPRAGTDPRRAAPALRAEVRRLAWERIGLVRAEEGLAAAIARLERLHERLPPGASEARSLLTGAWLIATAALARRESRGAHFRSDFPAEDAAQCRRLALLPRVDERALAARFVPAAAGAPGAAERSLAG